MKVAKEVNKIVQNLSRLRENRNITQCEIANAIGVTVGTVSRWENTSFKSTKWVDLERYMNYLETRGINLNINEFRGFQK